MKDALSRYKEQAHLVEALEHQRPLLSGDSDRSKLAARWIQHAIERANEKMAEARVECEGLGVDWHDSCK
jgi:hypothetical protein